MLSFVLSSTLLISSVFGSYYGDNGDNGYDDSDSSYGYCSKCPEDVLYKLDECKKCPDDVIDKLEECKKMSR